MATPLTNSRSGFAPFTYPSISQTLHTFYRIFGDISSSPNNFHPPLICLHGGPGLTHDLLLSHSLLSSAQFSIPVILYDQIGSGLSTHLPSTPPSLWNAEIFCAQLTQLLTHLGISQYDILGSSWGGMLAAEFAALRPKGLRRLILANSPASMALSRANREKYMRALREEEAVAEEELVQQRFLREHVCTVWPLPEDLLASVAASREDRTVIRAMEGESDDDESQSTGYLTKWSMVGKAKDIAVPALVINGVEEVASADAVKTYLDEIPDVRLVTIEGTTHSPHFERTEEYMRIVGEFLCAP